MKTTQTYEVCDVSGGSMAYAQLALLLSYARISKHMHHRGLQRLSWLLARFLSPQNAAVLCNADDRRLRVYLADGYWIRLLGNGFIYEPEIESILHATLSDDAVFVDCGANIGYWSVFAGSRIHAAHRILSVEATERNYQRLMENCKLNGESFTPIHAAVYSESGVLLRFITHPLRHAGNSMIDDRGQGGNGGYEHEEVRSLTIDDIIARAGLEHAEEIIVKVDVEGAEVAALQGARNAINNGAMLIYEDHGKDLECTVTQYVLGETGMDVYAIDAPRRLLQVDDIAQICRLKVDPARGYNFIAVRRDSALGERIYRMS